MLRTDIKTSIKNNFFYYFLYILFSILNPTNGMELAKSSDSGSDSGDPIIGDLDYNRVAGGYANVDNNFIETGRSASDNELHFHTEFDYYPPFRAREGNHNPYEEPQEYDETSTQPSDYSGTSTQLNSEWPSYQSSPVNAYSPSKEKLIKIFHPLPKNVKFLDNNTSSQRELTPLFHKSSPLYTLDTIRFINGDVTEMSAFTIYKGTQVYTNSEFQFMLQMDQHFFRRAPLAENFGQGMLGAIFWPTITFANAGVVMYTTADFLQIPYGKSGAIVQVTWLLATHAPVYGKQFYRIAQTIGDSLTGERPFKTSSEDDDPYSPHVYQKWRSHYLMNGAAILAASIHATTSMFFFFLAEEPFPLFAWTTGGFIFLSELERYATRANLDIDRRFTHAYDNAEEKRQEALHKKDKLNFPLSPYGINKMRKYLRLKTERFRYELDNDDFANASYDIIRTEIDKAANGDLTNSQSYNFKMSLLFLRDLSFFSTFDHKSNIEKPIEQPIEEPRSHEIDTHMKGTDSPIDMYNHHYRQSKREVKDLNDRIRNLDERIRSLEEQNQKLLNRKRMEKSLEPTLLDDVISRVSSGLIDAAWFARWAGMEYLLETTFIQLFSADPTTAAVLALGFSGYEVLFKSLTEYSIQRKYLEEILRNPFSLRNHVTLPWIRKPVGGTAFVNGIFSGLGKTVASLLAFNRWQIPLPFQIVAVASEFVVNTSYYAQFHEQECHNLITDIATAYSTNKTLEEMSVTEKRLWLHQWSNSIIPYLETGFDGRTIQLLFQISQRAI